MHKELEFSFVKDDVLARVEANREQHEKDYNDAIKGYWIELAEKLEELRDQLARSLAQAKNEENPDRLSFAIHLRKPQHYLDDYDRVIDMLKLTTEESIKLDESQYRQYVRDEWDWKQEFTQTNVAYHGKSRR